MRVLFCTNLPSPYRVAFFNKLGSHCELTVCYERRNAANRDAKWQAEQAGNFREVYLPLKPMGEESGVGNAMRRFIRDNPFDRVILSNYNSPACMEAIAWCRLKKIPYCMEYDGGLFKRDRLPLRLLKQWLLKPAQTHYSTCDGHISYLKSLGIDSRRIVKYPFSSLTQQDMEQNAPCSPQQKAALRQQLGIKEQVVVLAVGQFIHRKGFDVLLESARWLPGSIGVYFVGGEPTEEYLRLQKEYGLNNVHFVGFRGKQQLAKYYSSADVFVLPTRQDVWGLVINEAMSFGLPVITTDHCAAGLELIQNGINGYVLPVDDVQALADTLCGLCANPKTIEAMGRSARETILPYTVEAMASAHLEDFGVFP